MPKYVMGVVTPDSWKVRHANKRTVCRTTQSRYWHLIRRECARALAGCSVVASEHTEHGQKLAHSLNSACISEHTSL